jgi:hypothetical protein
MSSGESPIASSLDDWDFFDDQSVRGECASNPFGADVLRMCPERTMASGSWVGMRVVEERLFSREFQLGALNRLPQDLPL